MLDRIHKVAWVVCIQCYMYSSCLNLHYSHIISYTYLFILRNKLENDQFKSLSG